MKFCDFKFVSPFSSALKESHVESSRSMSGTDWVTKILSPTQNNVLSKSTHPIYSAFRLPSQISNTNFFVTRVTIAFHLMRN